MQADRNLREIVDRHPGSTRAVRLILKEDIGGQISLQRAAREAAAAREGLETGQEIVAARRALAAVEPALARARTLLATVDPVRSSLGAKHVPGKDGARRPL